MVFTAHLSVRFSDGREQEVQLRQGNNVIGKKGGPADVLLDAQSLSRRHAMITVRDRIGDCSVEDLGSTNKSAIVDGRGELFTLNPGNVYPLSEGSQLVLGDVQIEFRYSGDSRGSSVPSTALGNGNRNVMFVKTPQSRAVFILNAKATRGKTANPLQTPADGDRAQQSCLRVEFKGWTEDPIQDGFVNAQLGVRSAERPQNLICRNLYQEMKRKGQMEESLGTMFADESLPRLLVLDPSTQISLFHYVLPGRNVVGKSKVGVDITLDSSALSKRHGYVEMREGRIFVGDLGSTNGTYIGEFPHTESRKLDPGTEAEVFDGQLLLFADVECTLSIPHGGSIVRALTAGASSLGDSESIDTPLPPPSGARSDGARVNLEIDYDEIRKIIREEVSHAAGFVKELRADGKDKGSPTKGALKGVRHVGDNDDEDEQSDGVGEKSTGGDTEGHPDYPPPQVEYDVEEEVKLAEELDALESIVSDSVDEVRAIGGLERQSSVNSRKKGFLAREEARKQQMIDWAKQFYRKQSPYDELGKFMLPTGALHRILQYLDAVPHLCIISTVCHSLQRAASVTKPWKSVNGDHFGNLWSTIKLSGTRCADGHTLLSGLGPDRLGHVINMDLSGISTITDDTLAVIAEQCPLLQHLSLKCRVDIGPQVTDVGLEDIAACCPRLRSLSIAWCTKVTDYTMHAVAKSCRDLDSLEISFCSQVTDQGLLSVIQQCEKIEILRMESCDKITENGVVALSQYCPRLKTLSVAGCLQGATTLSIIQVARECQMLTHMDLTGVAGLEDAAVWQLSRGCRWLQQLLLAWCVQLSDQSFLQIASNCPLLTVLSLRGCVKLTDSAVVQLAQNCCYLRDLDIRGCDQVSQGGMDALAVMIPSCVVHFLDKNFKTQALQPPPSR